MNCPQCGAWAEVLEARQRTDGSTRRRYECGNEHRFTTVEAIQGDAVHKALVRPGRPRVNPERRYRSTED